MRSRLLPTTRAPLVAVASAPSDGGKAATRPAASIEDDRGGVPVVVLHWTGRESKALRAAIRLSQRAFGGRVGVSLSTIARWELGRAAVSTYGQQALDAVLRDAPADVMERFEALLKKTDAAITSHGSERGRRV
jgi:DNA-binding transcriptional regulator YiaG